MSSQNESLYNYLAASCSTSSTKRARKRKNSTGSNFDDSKIFKTGGDSNTGNEMSSDVSLMNFSFANPSSHSSVGGFTAYNEVLPTELAGLGSGSYGENNENLGYSQVADRTMSVGSSVGNVEIVQNSGQNSQAVRMHYSEHIDNNGSLQSPLSIFPTNAYRQDQCSYLISPEAVRQSNLSSPVNYIYGSPVNYIYSSPVLPVQSFSNVYLYSPLPFTATSPIVSNPVNLFSSRASVGEISHTVGSRCFKENVDPTTTPFDSSRSYNSSSNENYGSGSHLPKRLFNDSSSNVCSVSESGNSSTVLDSPFNFYHFPSYQSSLSVESSLPISVATPCSTSSVPDKELLLNEPFFVYNKGDNIYLLNLIPEFSVGSLDGSCPYCQALYFRGEMTTRKVYTQCCMNGTVSINRRKDFPQYLYDLYSGKSGDSNHFRTNIRKFNSAFAFASFGYQKESVPGTGPYCLKIGGNIHHKMSTSVSPATTDGTKSYCQIYILDTQEATKARFVHPANQNLLWDVMENVHNVLKIEHPFADILHNMRDLIHKEKALAKQENRPVVDYTIEILDCEAAKDDFRGSYDVVTSNEVAFIYKSIDDDQPPGFMNRAIHSRSSDKLQYLPRHSSLIDTLTYPLFFPRGEENWTPSNRDCGINAKDEQSKSESMQMWYRYALQIRPNSTGFSPILIGGKLTDQFICDVRLRIEGRNIDYFRKNQTKLRVESYIGLHEHLRKTATEQNKTAGCVYVLPSSFTGGPRYMSALYNDAMAMVSELGFPDLFITMTCNPKWKEIKDNLGFAKSPDERKDLIVRVFKLKLDELLIDIAKRNHFGKIRGYNCSIEFQKRGLPHAHIIVILDKTAKPRLAEDVDKYVSAELPNEKVHPELFSRVRDFMMHGPCGEGAVCSKKVDGEIVCKKKFPKAFQEKTNFDVDSYPVYKRRDNKGKCPDWKKRTIDNSYVVPYNPELLMKYNCHINVEIVSSIKAIKYIYKYCFKGVDRLCFQVVNENSLDYDELAGYTNGRYLCGAEAYWRIFEFKLFRRSHTIIRLPVHDEFRQSVVFTEGKEQEAYESAANKATMLTAYFMLNTKDVRARNLFYHEVPLYYRWMGKEGYWQFLQRRTDDKIVRLHACSPRDGERHSIRELLLNRKDCRSFEDLRTVNGVKFPSFREAAEFLGLINTDLYWKKLFDYGVLLQFSKGLRELFMSMCSKADTSQVLDIWTIYKSHLVEDFTNKGCGEDEAYDRGLIAISEGLEAMGKTLKIVGLPEPTRSYSSLEVPSTSDLEEIRRLCGLLNKDQLTAVQNVLSAVGRLCRKSFHQFSLCFLPQELRRVDPPKLFFLDGAGGTGKTFVYTVLCKIFEYSGIKHITVAPTGIAASILPNGRTAHSKFGIPLDLSKQFCSSISFDDPQADEIRDAKVVIWDEIGMTRRKMLEITNRLFLDVRLDHNGKRYSEKFGGCVVVAGGDFRQQGPVVKRGSRPTFLSSCVKSSELWPSFKKLQLHVNMRASSSNKAFAKFLLKVGDNSLPKPASIPSDYMEVPPEYLIDSSVNKDALIDFIFGKDLSDRDPLDFTNRAILCPRNTDALRMNEVILSRLPGETVTSYSEDSASFENDHTFSVLTEYLNSLTPSGCPPHTLNLKNNCVVMLLKNLNPKIGLVNGTRLIVKCISQLLLDCEILCGARKGQRVFLPKLEITPLDTDLPFQLRRTQFPVRLCYAMTIAKSQGQSLDYVGIYLNSHSFCHGQIYTAMSRSKYPENLKIDVVNSCIKKNGKVYIKNVVFKELL